MLKVRLLVKKRPYNDAGNIYYEITDKSEVDFIDLFEKWINENIGKFDEIIEQSSVQNVSVKIEHQENNGSGTIINAGIITHLGAVTNE